MLGFEGSISRPTSSTAIDDFRKASELPYPARADFAQGLLVVPPVAKFRAPGSVALDIVGAARSERATLIHDGGYPYLVAGRASLFRDALASSGVSIPAGIDDAELLVLVAWDQS